MGKTPKVKKREVSIHSRAAKRGASPPTKELANVTTPVEESEYKPWLHSAQSAGISKKKKTKQLTRQQKQRQQRGLEHAERNIDKLEKKVADSQSRGKRVKSRRVDWNELNEKLGLSGPEHSKENHDGEREESQDRVNDGKTMEGVEMPNPQPPIPSPPADQPSEAVAEKLAEKLEDAETVPLPASEDLDEVT